jgi:hypothetical protein
MQRRFVALLAVVAVLAMPALASAAVTVTAPNLVFTVGDAPQVVDVLVAANGGEGANSMDFSALINGNLPGSPIFTTLDISSAITVFGASPNTPANFLDPPGSEVQRSVTLNSTTTNVPLNGILARLTVDIQALGPGVYPWSINDPNATLPTVIFATTGEVVPSYIDGTITINPIVPEPSSMILGLFAAAGMAAVVIRRRRSA